MKSTADLRAWLLWVIKIRFVIISLVFAIDFVTRELAPGSAAGGSIERLGMVTILWYVIGLFFLIYHQTGRDYFLQARLQVYVDIAIITAVVHVTGDLSSNYLSLYVVAIILASILFSRAQAYLVAGVSFACLGGMAEIANLRGLYPELAGSHPALAFLASSSAPMDPRTLGVRIAASLFGFFAVAYLASFLAETLRRTGVELRDKAGQVESLAAINENIIQSMRGGLIRTGLDGTIHELNPAGARILGRTAEDMRGQRLQAALPEFELPGLKAGSSDAGVAGPADEDPSANEAGSNGGGLPIAAYTRREITYRRPEGAVRILGYSVSTLRLPEKGVAGYIYTFQDLTDEKRREADYQARDRMATLGRVAAAIAHEIRNPLASIAGSVQVLQSLGGLEADQAKLIEIVNRESSRLEKLVSEFLAYSREQRLKFREVDLTALLDETLLLLEHHPRVMHAECRLERNFPPQPVVAAVDPDRLRQVLWNICDNSLKAMPAGGVLSAAVEGEARQVRVILGDTGVGLSAEQLDRLFEPFRPGFAQGTGLGLAITRQIVEAHGGTIRVESQPGQGTRFVIELPREHAPDQEAPLQEAVVQTRRG
ncbi:MAG TPA: ATP-binding protein [Terriglobia bacterium]|nr:ATP-binding protein [Terriglobia bacterium]